MTLVRIRTAIFGVYVAASAVGLVVLMTFILRDVRLRYVESMRRTLSDTAALFASLLETNPSVVDERADLGAAWRDSQPAFARTARGLRVYVTDAQGRVVFDGNDGRDLGRDYAVRPEMKAYFDKAYDARGDMALADGELRVTVPVHRGDEVIGFVGVARPLSTITEAVFRARVRLALGALSVAVVMLAAGWWIASKLTHSLERLTEYAQAVRDGRRATPPESRATEIAALVRAFEEMRVTLEGKAHVERYTQALAHEFKAPLSAIRGAAELLGEDMPREDRVRFLANVRAESSRLQAIVERLLELAALEARRDDVAHEAVDLGNVTEEIVAQSQALAAAKSISLGGECAAAIRVSGDRFLLAQAISNLVHNALEFTPAGGSVTVAVAKQGSRAVVCVEDTGPGVPGYALEKIFDRFYSLPRPDTGRKSSGLGLSIVREIARLHGGDVTLENRAEGGARAKLTLPIVEGTH